MRRVPVFLLLAGWTALTASSARADSWADSLFPERSFDFGTVARGSKIHHSFRLVNRTSDDIHIATWRTKCGCTEVRVGAQLIPSGTQTSIEAVIDTTKFLGPKASGLTLILDRPGFAEIDLNLNCFIRGDLVVSPGQADFGTVQRAAKPVVTLNLTYAGGQPNWAITEMKTRSDHVSARLEELGRSYGSQVQYLLTVTLKPTVGNGYFKDEISLITNDPTSRVIPLSVTANVQTAVVISPSIIHLGRVKPGAVVKKTVLVRSAQPFKLTTLKASKDDLTATPDPDGARPLHKVDITFKAPAQPGPYNAVFEIATDLKDEPPAKLTTFATIAP
jgi:hypothetical protein